MSFDTLRETAMFQQQYSKDKYIRICPSYDGYGIVVYAKNGDDSSQVSNYILTNNNIKKYAILPWVSGRHQEIDGDLVVDKFTATDITVTGQTIHAALIDSGSMGRVILRANEEVQCMNNSGSWIPVKASAFNTQSSLRYKKNIEPMEPQKAKSHILSYRPVSGHYLTDSDNDPKKQMLIAEEVAEINPYPVSYDKDGRPDAIDYSKFVPEIISVTQTLIQENNYLRAKIDALEEKCNDMEILKKELALLKEKLK